MTKAERDRPTVELVKSRYQPSKAELEADARLNEGGQITLIGLAEMTRRLMKPVNIRWIPRPKR